MSLLCEHSELYSQAWPTQGSMRNGQAFARPTQAHPTAGSASSSSPGLPTPRARDWKRLSKDGLEELLLLKTPTSQLAVNGGSQHPDKRKAGGHGPTLADEVEHLLPTPTVEASARCRTANRRAPKATTSTTGSTLLDVFWDGAPTDLPLPAGSTSPDDGALFPLSPDETATPG